MLADSVRTMNTVNVCVWINILLLCLLATSALAQDDQEACPDTQYYNGTTCLDCTVCAPDEKEREFCTANEDRVCEPRCSPEFSFNVNEGCVLNCLACESGGCVPGEPRPRCLCIPQQCFNDDDRLCERNTCPATTEPGTATAPPRGSSQNSLPAWGVGLVSIGVVVGIVAFSGCFILLGVCTRKKEPADVGSEESGSSQSGLIGMGRVSSRPSSAPPGVSSSHLFDKSALDFIRQSPYIGSGRSPHLGGGHIRGSPLSLRGTPPRTERNIIPV